MAAFQLKQPEPFDFKDPDSWPKWKRRFLQYQEAAGLSGESEARQINTLLYCLGGEANEVLMSTSITEDERRRFARVIGKFNEYFKVRRNVIFERARFNLQSQLPGETADTYIAELYRLVEHCEYGNLKDEMIRDRLVVGILDKKTLEQLQIDPALTVEKAKKTIRQKEAVREQGQALEQDKKHNGPLEELGKTIAEMQASWMTSRRAGASVVGDRVEPEPDEAALVVNQNPLHVPGVVMTLTEVVRSALQLRLSATGVKARVTSVLGTSLKSLLWPMLILHFLMN